MFALETAGPGNYAIGEQSMKDSPAVNVPTTGLSIEELRTRNRIQSPLLRLSREMLICLLLFTIDDAERAPTWTTILLTCNHLCQVVLSAPQLRGRIYCLPPEKMLRRFEMAAWSPTEIYADFASSEGEKEVKVVLDSVRDAGRLRRDRIHTLEFYGETDVWGHFSWIFDEPCPHLKYLSESTWRVLPSTSPSLDHRTSSTT